MIDNLIYHAVTVFIVLAVIDTVFILIVLVGAVKRPKHYKLKRGQR